MRDFWMNRAGSEDSTGRKNHSPIHNSPWHLTHKTSVTCTALAWTVKLVSKNFLWQTPQYRLDNSSPRMGQTLNHMGTSSAGNVFSAAADSHIPLKALTTVPKLENTRTCTNTRRRHQCTLVQQFGPRTCLREQLCTLILSSRDTYTFLPFPAKAIKHCNIWQHRALPIPLNPRCCLLSLGTFHAGQLHRIYSTSFRVSKLTGFFVFAPGRHLVCRI